MRGGWGTAVPDPVSSSRETDNVARGELPRVLIFGFSVTAQKPSFVGVARTHFDLDKSFHVEKFAIGGVFPPAIRHLFPSVISEFRPDIVILEMATATYRMRPATDDLIREHTQSICSMFAQCAVHGASCAILDLPQEGLNAHADWMGPLHEALCKQYGIARLELPLLEGTLGDNVHTNAQGDLYYAKGLCELLFSLPPGRGIVAEIEDTPWFDAIPVAEVFPGSPLLRKFFGAASVFTAHTVLPGKPLIVRFEKPVLFSGITSLFNPMAGNVRITCDGESFVKGSYDAHSYYESIGCVSITPRLTKTVSIEQLDQRPDVALQKGTAYEGHRVGSIVHLLVQTESRRAGFDFPLIASPAADECETGDAVLKNDRGGVRFLFDLHAPEYEGNETGSEVLDFSRRSGAADIVSVDEKGCQSTRDMRRDDLSLRSYIRAPMESVYDLNRGVSYCPSPHPERTQEFLVTGYYTLPAKEHWHNGPSLLPLFSASRHGRGFLKSAELVIFGMNNGPHPCLEARRQFRIGETDLSKTICVPEDAFGKIVQIAYWRRESETGFTLRTKNDRYVAASDRGLDNDQRFTDMIPGWGACPPFLTDESKGAYRGISVHRGWIENLGRSRRDPVETLESDWRRFSDAFSYSAKPQ